jgi:RHS repeat-associated protein
VSQISFTNNGVQRMVTTKQYDFLNRLTSVASINPQPSTINSFAYQYNSANQRTARTNDDHSYWVYQYDSLGQVTSGKRYWSDNTPVPGQQFEYAFDDIGNRSSAKSGGDGTGLNLRTATYNANNLNQYTNRTVPGYAELFGSADADANVILACDDNLALVPYRHGEYFRHEFALNNSTGAVSITVTNIAALPGNPDIIDKIISHPSAQQTPEAFTYDADGNLTSDGLWTNHWDAENRLVGMESLSSVPAGSRKKLDFAYDYLGRRTQKIVSTWNGSSFVPQSTNCFAYDVWNLIADLRSGLCPVRTYVWGLDAIRSRHRTGGIGALLAVSDGARGTHFATFDGNNNLTALVDCTDASLSASYEYGPYAEVLRASGIMVGPDDFGFSTKVHDLETGFLYYGTRYFDVLTGRWLSRDPVHEGGAPNLYQFVENDMANNLDAFGKQGMLNGPLPAGVGLPTEPTSSLDPVLPENLARPTLIWNTCCSASKVEKEKQALIDRYRSAKASLEARGVMEGMKSCGNWSCNAVNDPVLRYLQLAKPTCWRCVLERRSSWYSQFKTARFYTGLFRGTLDHWIVVCTATSLDRMSFDYWEGRPPGEDPADWFYRMYPRPGYPEEGGASFQYGDPTGTDPDPLSAIPSRN